MRVRALSLVCALGLVSGCSSATTTRSLRTPSSADDYWEFASEKIGKKEVHYWQLKSSTTGESVNETDRKERREKDQACPAGMVAVSGEMNIDNPMTRPIEILQEDTCDDWMDPPKAYPRRCAVFNKEKWDKILPTLRKKTMPLFCMDRYEYPNKKGVNPPIDMTWYEAKALCEKEDKRLCTEDEWTFACEGEEALPYSYGYKRSAQVCNIDKPWTRVNEEKLGSREKAGEEIAHLWQGEPIGSRPNCVSPFGVYDMTGNVDEWTQSTHPKGVRSILKGGYWSVVRNRCRPSTRRHNESSSFYQQGFRCCK